MLIVIIGISTSYLTAWITSLDFDQIFNLIEALFWITISLVFLLRRKKQKNLRHLSLVASIAFLAFGISDLIEIQTRAWYNPIGLFILKAICVVTLLILLTIYIKWAKKTEQSA